MTSYLLTCLLYPVELPMLIYSNNFNKESKAKQIELFLKENEEHTVCKIIKVEKWPEEEEDKDKE